MVMATDLDRAERTALATRLKSIEGQARGIQRMLEDGRDCQGIHNQVAALQAVSHAACRHVGESFAHQCLRESPDTPEQVLTQFLGVVSKLTR